MYVLEYLCRALYPEQATPALEAEKGIYLTGLVFSGADIAIAGVAKTWGDIIELQRRLTNISPDRSRPLFTMANFGQTYTLSAEAGATGESRYNFEMTLSVNLAALAPLVSDYAGVTADLFEQRRVEFRDERVEEPLGDGQPGEAREESR